MLQTRAAYRATHTRKGLPKCEAIRICLSCFLLVHLVVHDLPRILRVIVLISCVEHGNREKRLDSRYCIAAEAIIVVVPSNACHTREHFMFILWWVLRVRALLLIQCKCRWMLILWAFRHHNDTHRTCNAQQLRMDFRQTNWPNANGIKSEIRGTHQNNLTAETATDDSAKAEIHLFFVCFAFTMNWPRRANSK